MNISNLSNIVDQLGLSFSCVVARKDLVSFSLNQLNILNNLSRKFSQIDLLDKKYPNNEILVKFFRNGFRVLEESFSLVNTNSKNTNLPRSTILLGTNERFLNTHNMSTHHKNLVSKVGSTQPMIKLERLLNDTLISFFCIAGNSGFFLQNLNLINNIVSKISIKSLRYPCLVYLVGIISKCELFRLTEFYNFVGSIFSYFTRNHKALSYLNDLDTTLLLFHKIAILYITHPKVPFSNICNIEKRKNEHHEQLLKLLEVSIDKVSQIINYTSTDPRAFSTNKHMKSINNLVQSVFLINEFDKGLISSLSYDKLANLHSILSSSYELVLPSDQHYLNDIDPDSDKLSTKKNGYLNNTSYLHLKIGKVLSEIIDSDNLNGSSTSGDNYSSKECKDVKKVLNEIRVGSSLYFIDLLVV